jgi:dephospho-CoA kinase
MKLLGVTGGVGMGKSACCDLLHKRRVAVIDTDQLARNVVEPGQPALAEIHDIFGGELIDDAGRLRRDLMAQRVFSDPAARQQLETILHPRIRKLWQEQVNNWRIRQFPLGAVVIPLLFETHAEKEFDAVICVACSPDTQMERLRARGWADRHVQQRIGAQWPVDQKIARADHIIWTEGPLAIHAEQLDRICAIYG